MAYIEGDRDGTNLRSGYDFEAMSDVLIEGCFQMARNLREFDRTGDIQYARYHQYYRTRAVFLWEHRAEAERLADC